jgi:hypothetical protein
MSCCSCEKKAIALERLLTELMLNMHPDDAIGIAWEYHNTHPFKWYGDSSKLNIYTELENCYDGDGSGYPEGTILHYTHDRQIYGTSKDLDPSGKPYGEQPMFYMGYFEIDNHDFELSFLALQFGKIQFVPKKEAGFEYNNK